MRILGFKDTFVKANMMLNYVMAGATNNVPLDVLFRALADPTRLRLLNLLSEQEMCVCYFTEVLRAPQPKISRHLAYLRRAGIVASRRDGKWMHYKLRLPKEPHAAAILKTAIASLRQNPEMQRDWDRLERACCGPRSLVQVLGAPAPIKVPEAQPS
jgi:ArsR family transcriptional regulator